MSHSFILLTQFIAIIYDNMLVVASYIQFFRHLWIQLSITKDIRFIISYDQRFS